jgi:hypothetical protein
VIVQKLPDLEHFGITDRLAHAGDRRNGLGVSPPSSLFPLQQLIIPSYQVHLPILSKLSKLKSLRLPDATSVGVSDFDGGPWCGNAYELEDGSPDVEYIQQIADQWREAENEAATLVGKAFGPQLVEVQLDEKKFRFERDEDGNFTGLIPR